MPVTRNADTPITTGLVSFRLVFQVVPGVQVAGATYIDSRGAKRSVFHAGMKVDLAPLGEAQSTLETGSNGELRHTFQLGSTYSVCPVERSGIMAAYIDPTKYAMPPDTRTLTLLTPRRSEAKEALKGRVQRLAYAAVALSERLGYQSPGASINSLGGALDPPVSSAIPLSAERALVAAERWLDSCWPAQDCRFPLGHLGLLQMLQKCDVPGSLATNAIVHGKSYSAANLKSTQAIGALEQWKRWDLTVAERVPIPFPASVFFADNSETIFRIVFARFEREFESLESLSRGRSTPFSFVSIDSVDGLPTIALRETTIAQVRLVAPMVVVDAPLLVETWGPIKARFAGANPRKPATLREGGKVEIEADELPPSTQARTVAEAPRGFVIVSTRGSAPTVVAVLQVVVWPSIKVGLQMYLPVDFRRDKAGLTTIVQGTMQYLNAMYSQAGVEFSLARASQDNTFGAHKLTTTVQQAARQPPTAPVGETLPIQVQALDLSNVNWGTPTDQLMTPDAARDCLVPILLVPEKAGVKRLEVKDSLTTGVVWGIAHPFGSDPDVSKKRPARFVVLRVSGLTATALARIFAHEIGHFLGLCHPYGADEEVYPQVVAPEIVDSIMAQDGAQAVVEPRIAEKHRTARGAPQNDGQAQGVPWIRTGYAFSLGSRSGWKPEVNELRRNAEKLNGGGYK